VEAIDDALVVSLPPARSIDSDEFAVLTEQLEGVLETALSFPNHWVILDFEDTRLWTLSERAMETFTWMQFRLRSTGGRLVFCRLRPDVLESLRLLGREADFEIQPDIQAALDAL
jgi:hypothetical protein